MGKGKAAFSLGRNRCGFVRIQHISDEAADLKKAAANKINKEEVCSERIYRN